MNDDVESLARHAINCGLNIHKELGPGLLESVYEAVLAASLADEGFAIESQKIIPIRYKNRALAEAFRADIIVNHRLIIEGKSVERASPVHAKQLLTYLRLTEQPLGLLMKFGAETFRDGLRRVVNGPSAFIRTRT